MKGLSEDLAVAARGGGDAGVCRIQGRGRCDGLRGGSEDRGPP